MRRAPNPASSVEARPSATPAALRRKLSTMSETTTSNASPFKGQFTRALHDSNLIIPSTRISILYVRLCLSVSVFDVCLFVCFFCFFCFDGGITFRFAIGRSQSFRHTSPLHSSGVNTSLSVHPLLPVSDNAVGKNSTVEYQSNDMYIYIRLETKSCRISYRKLMVRYDRT